MDGMSRRRSTVRSASDKRLTCSADLESNLWSEGRWEKVEPWKDVGEDGGEVLGVEYPDVERMDEPGVELGVELAEDDR